MSKIYYKVVTPSLKSVIMSCNKFTTQYKIGEFVSSPYPKTPLCVFKDLADVEHFTSTYLWEGYKIFTCEIENKYRKPWIPYDCSLNYILELIAKKKRYIHLVYTLLPLGTICCKKVKLLEEVSL